MSFSDWREVRIGEVISFNPSESLKKGEIAKKIAMEQLEPFTRKIANYELSKFTGGSKFRNGDTLFARITPCLENGKTAYVNILDDNEVAFGSTEFIVMRKKEKITDDMFVYYLAISPDFRNKAIQSMTGTSGRQRVQQDVLQSHKIMLPPLHEQKAIAATLSALDDMIELNNQINKTLEEMAQAIFKSWFVDFEPFRDGEFEESEIGPIPKGWKVGMLGDFVEIVDNRGKTPPLSDVKTEYPIIDVRALSGESRVIDYSNCTKYVEKEIYDSWFRSGHPKHLDILISTVGSIAEMKMFYGNKGCIAQNVVAFRSNGISPCYLYQYLQYSKGDLLSYNIGSVQPSIKVTHVIKYKIIVPDEKTMSSFDMLMESISDQIHRNANESQILIAIRDTLLPKLISGEIRVPVEEVV
ncbi:restriction endonuclease subunit S [Acetivibrio clariflavus]|uniref:Restriction endonuclease S subunit n=1 Tax=Acetivibrio clariflavus (strain DSM 19732 / NBRC 101661 / EBR45) TaxID=720554 RepID=G8LZD0_ACECE|nr:restriction endonuclease subunit S [Acetivibrio clariflavus]AEV70092.1 restriction endonuclease S subunit [Acetivibrio clariflavus DSM 19732]